MIWVIGREKSIAGNRTACRAEGAEWRRSVGPCPVRGRERTVVPDVLRHGQFSLDFNRIKTYY
jgi:hypothetical protein